MTSVTSSGGRWRRALLAAALTACAVLACWWAAAPRPGTAHGTPSVPLPSPHALPAPVEYAVRQTEDGGKLPADVVASATRDPVAAELTLAQAQAAMAPGERIVVVTTSCGDVGTEDLVTWLKALLLFGAGAGEPLDGALALLDVHLFVDETSRRLVRDVVARWALPAPPLQLTLHDAVLPAGIAQLFKPCALQRLFLADLLPPNITHALYLDRDMLVLGDLRPLWAQAKRFGPSQMFAMAIETTRPAASYYRTKRTTINPWGLAGINSGLLLTDLAKVRATHTIDAFVALYKARQKELYLGDQDLLNAWLHDHPEQLVPLSCRWNFRGDCRDATLSVLHMNRQSHRLDADRFPGEMWFAVLSWPILPLRSELVARAQASARNTTAQRDDGFRSTWNDV